MTNKEMQQLSVEKLMAEVQKGTYTVTHTTSDGVDVHHNILHSDMWQIYIANVVAKHEQEIAELKAMLQKTQECLRQVNKEMFSEERAAKHNQNL